MDQNRREDSNKRRITREERIGLEQINKRAQKRESQIYQNFATNDINPMNSFFLRHAKAMGFVATESIHNVLFHVIETVKVRGQARNLVSGDVSHYFKNQVEKKPLISGIVSGFLGAATGAVAFQTMFNYLTIYFYCN